MDGGAELSTGLSTTGDNLFTKLLPNFGRVNLTDNSDKKTPKKKIKKVFRMSVLYAFLIGDCQTPMLELALERKEKEMFVSEDGIIEDADQCDICDNWGCEACF